MGPGDPAGLTDPIDPRLRVAVDASVGWYEEIFAAHGVGFRAADGVWRADGPAPPLHSALITLAPDVTTEAVRDAIVDRAWGGLKDSFAAVDGRALGMAPLIDAEWIHRPAADISRRAETPWRRIRDGDELAAWNERAGTEGIMLPSLLERPNILVLERSVAGTVAGGAILRVGALAVEVSNVHAVGGARVDREELAAAAGTLCPGLALVGWESGADLTDAADAGWDRVGPVRIWAFEV